MGTLSGSIPVSTTKQHFTKTVTQPTSGAASGVQVRLDNLTGNVTISNLKIELGNVATDYTPAPEDIDSSIGSINDTLSKQSSSISQLNNAITSKVEKTDVYTKSESDGKISSAVSTAKSEIKQTTDSITSSVNSVSQKVADTSQNIVRNTSFINNLDYWSVSAGVIDSSKAVDGNNAVKIEVSGQTADVWRGIISNRINVGAGQSYNASIYTYADDLSLDTSGSSYYLEVEWFNAAGTRISTSRTQCKPSSVNNWQRFNFNVKAPSNAIECTFRAYVQRNGRMWVSRPMFVLGDKLPSTYAPMTADNALTDMNTQINQTAYEVSTNVVKKGNVVTSINASSEGVRIKGDKIDISGAVTFNSLNPDMQSKVNAGTSALSAFNDLDVGGTNMLTGTNFDSLSGFYRWGSGVINNITNDSYVGFNYLQMETKDGSGNYLTVSKGTAIGVQTNGHTFRVIKGRQYTVSMIIATSELDGVLDYCYLMHGNGSNSYSLPNVNTYDFPYVIDVSSGSPATRGYYKVSYTFTADVTDDKAYILVGGRTTRDLDASSGYAWIRISQLQVEEGNKATSWSPSPVDVAQRIVEGKLYIRGTGYDRSGNRILRINDREVYSLSGRGLRLTTIDRNTLATTFDQTYDVYSGSTARQDLANKLNSLSDDVIVTVTSYDAIHTADGVSDALARCGGSGVTLTYRNPYALIGIPNIGKGAGIEVYYPAGSSSPYAEISTRVENGVPVGINVSSLKAINDAQSTADSAVSKANSAQSSANSAQSTANSATSKANSAQSAADSAQATANSAKSDIADMSSDGKITPIEKVQLKKEWATIVAEKTTLYNMGSTFGKTSERDAFNTSYNNLNTLLNGTGGVLTNMSSTSTVTGSTFRNTFDDYYDKRLF
ncbi:interleukin-like EMT inducer domain-containing protein [Priestia megaterium]